ncbi:tetraacyldisaccharide 4'-kinase [Terriglobus sp. TAA 43]|uniref:tetraacyldisaccharide 4'-kinase n=1 Tax=Terriglobus sp. TAA 43 TaxID=278961 RepID=UPI00068AF895|nr:tetraacyldisaccharide 4'-kinase [Terriglobus sp. TAA 43]
MKRPWLLPLVPLWAVGAAWKNRAFDRGSVKVEQLELPVISVGSLSAGGAGKTPFVIALGEALRRSGIGFDVLSRGYGRTVDAQAAKRVVGTGSAEEFGDEPLMIARRLGRRVYVAAERAAAGRMAEREHRAQRETGPWVHLLDDGFQHRRLARAVDIVLLTQVDVQDALLPAGDLRESLKSLRRADVIVLRKEEAARLRPVVERVVASAKKKPLVWEMERGFHFVEGAPASSPLAFCGIARPDAFLESLRLSGVEPASFVALKDHQRYDDGVMQRLVETAERMKANGFVTTVKDAVKLSPAMRATLQRVGPIAVADIEVTICDEARFIPELMKLL